MMFRGLSTVVVWVVVAGIAGPAHAIPMGLGDGDNTNEVLVDGKIWRQVGDIRGISWNDIDAVCDSNGAPSEGVECGANGVTTLVTPFGTVDLDGWYWATVGEVGELFNAITGQSTSHPGIYEEIDAPWAASALASDFAPLLELIDKGGDFDRVTGLTSTMVFAGPPRAYVPRITNSRDGLEDFVETNVAFELGVSGHALGAWFYRRPAASVSAPGAASLLALGMLLARRRRRVGAEHVARP